MSHYEERLERDLTHITTDVAKVALQVEQALKDSVHALLTGNSKLAYATILADGPINRAVRAIDRDCHRFIARHLPSAGPLRMISSIIRAGIILERIGDYAVTISREAVQLSGVLDETIVREVELIATESRQMLHQSIDAFNNGNADLALGTMKMATQVGNTFSSIFSAMLEEQSLDTAGQFALMSVFSHLERVSDQAKNLCEEAVFSATGQTKAKKVYRILFVDEDNSCMSQMAVAIAHRLYPRAGIFRSAGRQPAGALNAKMEEFLGQHDIEVAGAKPVALDLSPQELADMHVIVSLQGPVESYVSKMPFHTVALEWDIAHVSCAGTEVDPGLFEEMYREISTYIRDLMELLRGEEHD